MPSIEASRYHIGQYASPYESTVAFAEMIRTVVGRLHGRVLDVGCGAGANMHWLDVWGTTAGCDVTGVDADASLLELAQRYISPAQVRSVSFLKGSFLDPLPRCETALSVQVLSFIEDWRPAMRELLAAATEWVFVSSLFWEGVGTHTHASDGDKVNEHYNVIDTRAFESLCAKFGGAVERWQWHRPTKVILAPRDRLRSRTVGSETFSGPVYLPWAFAAVKKA